MIVLLYNTFWEVGALVFFDLYKFKLKKKKALKYEA